MPNNENIELSGKVEYRRGPEFEFTDPNALLFITGAPLSGKSTIAPIIAASIKDCIIQSMDIIRLVAQDIDARKPRNRRNPFVQYGSCDSYVFVGDGSYSEESLITGFNAYADAVSSVLTTIVPKLETQGARNVLFEGVQLTPKLMGQHLTDGSRMIVVVINKEKVESNRNSRYGDEQFAMERYQTERILLIQDELLRQAKELPEEKVIVIDNSGNVDTTVNQLFQVLLTAGVIKPRQTLQASIE